MLKFGRCSNGNKLGIGRQDDQHREQDSKQFKILALSIQNHNQWGQESPPLIEDH